MTRTPDCPDNSLPDRPTRHALRTFCDVIFKRIRRLLGRYSVLVHVVPGASEYPLPPAKPPSRLGETVDQYRHRAVTGFLRRGAVIKHDISAYYYYRHQVDSKAIFEFAALDTPYALQEGWVQTQLVSWQRAGKQVALGKFFGFYRGKRPRQSQAEKQVIAGLVRIRVDHLRAERGWSIQKTLCALAERPLQMTLDDDDGRRRITLALTKSALEDMYYRRGSYFMYDLRSWQLFYQVYTAAEALMRCEGQPSPLPKTSARYHRLYALPLIPESVVSPSGVSVSSRPS